MSEVRPSVPAKTEDHVQKKVKTGAHLPWWRAMFHPFKSGEIDFYPRLGNPAASVTTSTVLTDINAVTDAWTEIGDGDDLDDALDLAKASLAEAKAQTEYQDQKATRLLTVTTFLTALAGAFFGSFSADYPLRTLRFDGPGTSWLIIATYVVFFLFLISAILGALISFHATRTRFKYPRNATVSSQDGPTRSFLFFREMIGVTPAGWANSFVEGQGKDAKIKADLKLAYLKNYICEAYLVAAKTADKLRYLEPAQVFLGWALRFLLIYVLLLAVVSTVLPSTKRAALRMKVELVQPAPAVTAAPDAGVIPAEGTPAANGSKAVVGADKK